MYFFSIVILDHSNVTILNTQTIKGYLTRKVASLASNH